MTSAKAIVQKTWPEAWCAFDQSPGRWVVTRLSMRAPERLGMGDSPQGAWRNAAIHMQNGTRCV